MVYITSGLIGKWEGRSGRPGKGTGMNLVEGALVLSFYEDTLNSISFFLEISITKKIRCT